MQKTAMSEEVEINIPAMLRRTVSLWRYMLVMAVIFACLLGGYKYYSDLREAREKNSKETVSTDSLRKKLSEDELTAVDAAVRLKSYIDKMEGYQNRSTLMKVDAFNESVVMTDFYVDAEKLSNTDKERINANYILYMKSREFSDALGKALGWKLQTQNISELIGIDNKFTVYGNGTTGDAVSNCFRVNVIKFDDTEPEKIADAVTDILNAYEVLDGKYNGRYKLIRDDWAMRIRLDQTTVDSQSAVITTINNRKTNLKDQEDELRGDAKKLYELYISDKEEEESSSKKEVAHASINLKYIVLGFLVGIVMFIVCLFALYAVRPVVSPVTNVRAMIPLKYAGRVRKDGGAVDEISSVIAFKLKHAQEPDEKISYLCWKDFKDTHKSLASALAGGSKVIELSENNREEVISALDGLKNVVILLEDEITPISRVRDIVSVLNENGSALIAYVDME